MSAMPGGILSLSANGTEAENAIVWASIPIKRKCQSEEMSQVFFEPLLRQTLGRNCGTAKSTLPINWAILQSSVLQQ